MRLCGAQVIQPTSVWVITVSWVSPKTFLDCWSCLLGHGASALSLGTARVLEPVSSTRVLSGCLCMRCFGHVLPAGSFGHTQDTQSKSRLARELVNVPTEEMWEVAVEKESGVWLNCCPHDRISCRKWMDGCLVWCVHRMLHSRPNVPRTCNDRWALSLTHMPRVVCRLAGGS